MKLLVRRYVTAEQRKRDDYGITEDDVMEIRQDISSLRYELIDILRQNGMKTPRINLDDCQGIMIFIKRHHYISIIIIIFSIWKKRKGDGKETHERFSHRHSRRHRSRDENEPTRDEKCFRAYR